MGRNWTVSITLAMTASGQSRRSSHVRDMSAYPSIAAELARCSETTRCATSGHPSFHWPSFVVPRSLWLEMRHRHLSGRHFEKDNQATFACPIRRPALEDRGIERNAINGGFSHAPAVAAIPDRAPSASCALPLSEVFIPRPKPELLHCRTGRNCCHY